MKKLVLFILLALLLTLSSTVSARVHHHDWNHPSYHNENWHHAHYESLPFGWHEHHHHFAPSRYRMDRIFDHEWNDRFPGLHSYRWHDRHDDGFWYHGHRVADAVLFYNDSDELVSVGFMHEGAFIMMRDDHDCYENHDSFFLSWWQN